VLSVLDNESAHMPAAALVAGCQRMLGTDLTGYIGGAADRQRIDAHVEAWLAAGEDLDVGIRQRLLVAYLITVMLTRAMPEHEAREWLRDVNPALDNRSPAFLIREGLDDATYTRLLDEAFHYASSVPAALSAASGG
jgi:hypothetical protein